MGDEAPAPVKESFIGASTNGGIDVQKRPFGTTGLPLDFCEAIVGTISP